MIITNQCVGLRTDESDMNNEFKWVMLLIAAFVIAPLLGLGVEQWRKQDCRIELAKIGKSVDEIKELCK